MRTGKRKGKCMFIPNVTINDKMPRDTIIILKKDLETENGVFKTGTRVVFEEDHELVTCVQYYVHSADASDYMYVDDEKASDLIKNTFEIDTERTKIYENYLSTKTKKLFNAVTIIFIAVFIVIALALSIAIWKIENPNGYLEIMYTLGENFALIFAVGVPSVMITSIIASEESYAAKKKLEIKRNELLK